MNVATAGTAAVVALGLRYPTEESLAMMRTAVATLPGGRAAKELRRFVSEIDGRSLAELEELYTRTFDLSPLVVPYVGHLAWGDSYRRGEFMADMKAAMRQVGVDPGGELPDHLEPILRYLTAVDEPHPDLAEILVPAIVKMEKMLRKAEPTNPYRRVLAAARVVADERMR